MEAYYKKVQIIKSVVMPDHVHFVVFIREYFNLGLGKIVRFFKGNCTKHICEVSPDFAARNISIFADGYNDRIVFRTNILDTLVKYVDDNPRRHLMRQLYPAFFRNVKRLKIQDQVFDAYGNLDLLFEPNKSPLIISTRYTEEERKEYEANWEETLRYGGVFVSPFISGEEKDRRNKYIDAGASVIHIVSYSFGERYKPYGKMFDLCSLGRLLLLSEVKTQTLEKQMMRSRALHMNEIARWLVKNTKNIRIMRK